ncbi:amino acid adenylation domain-containing protein [Micromonospora sp. WMMD1082]|uniref:non-ribosomal peptide synthetase n=1 Tax=Micromonospora sp. WMMD1082 TaxID=3016104 RepID=UPI002416BFF7|nr:amino acid adenylation domain-containing protein [Micromonospora sp. WMMD1082]MDG4797028.1 amino acid adenylation domain-containing protein [Micromonospora sp. WMMD1082]
MTEALTSAGPTGALGAPTDLTDDPRHVEYWRRHLRGAPPRLGLPYDRPPVPGAPLTAASCELTLPPEVGRAVGRLARRERASALMVVTAAAAGWASRLTGQDDVLVSTPLARARHPEHVLPVTVRLDCAGEPTFTDLLRHTRDVLLDALAHRNLDASTLLAISGPPQLAVSVGPTPPPMCDGTELHLWVAEDGGRALLHYRSPWFAAATARRLLDQLTLLLAGTAVDDGTRLSELPMLSPADRELLDRLPRHRADAPLAVPAQLFAETAAARPDAVAVRTRDTTISYRELEDRATRLAHHLRRSGAGRGSVVGVCVGRGVDLPLSFLAVLKSGAAYLPLDPRHPAERIRDILTAAGASLVVTTSGEAGAVAAHTGPLLLLDRDAEAIAAQPDTPVTDPPAATDLAYVIYTSGSTGRPKGVEITQAGLANLAVTLRDRFAVGPDDRTSLFSSAAFDASVWEMAMAFAGGASLGVLSTAEATPAEIAAEIRELGLTVGTYPPTLLRALTPDDLGNPRVVVSAGEQCDTDLAAVWAPGRRFVNAYGPTETTVCATFTDVAAPVTSAPPIGVALPNLAVYLLDRALRPVPVGAPGEIFVAGVGLARGYRAQPATTAAAFLPDPHGPAGSRMYRTGDLGRFGNDGQLHHLGRVDHQVKLRGFRVELGEIEHHLMAQPEVRDAAVVVRRDGGHDRLVAYLTLSDPTIDPVALRGTLRAPLSRALPDYMLPASYLVLDAMPLNSSGKIDRAALPEPSGEAADEPAGQWQTPDEQRIAGYWREALGVPRVGRTDSFFELGGHSLVAAQMIGSVRQAYQLTRLPMRLLFEKPVLADFAAAVRRLQSA